MPIPASLTPRTVTGHIEKGDGSPEEGKVLFKRSVVLESETDNLFLTPYVHTATLDANGNFSISLPVVDDPQWTPQLWAYTVDIQVSAWQYRFDYALLTETGTPIDLSDILPPGPVPTPVTDYVTKASIGSVGGPAGPLDDAGKLPLAQIPDGVGGGTVATVNSVAPDAGGNVLLNAADVGAAPTGHGHAMADVTGLSSALNGKADAVHTHGMADVTGLDTALAGKAGTSHTHAQADVTGLATTLAGKSDTGHTHTIANVTGLQTALDGKQAAGSYAAASHTHTTAQVTGLDTALTAKAPLASPSFTGTVSGVTKSMVGLGNADNTSDVAKPVSTAQQAALDEKWDILVLAPADPIPGGTRPNKTLIFRTA